jgi:hypothetical protein
VAPVVTGSVDMVLSRYLDECAARAAGVLGTDVEASVTLREHGLTLRAGSSGVAAARCDRAEAMVDDGPCIDAMGDDAVVEVPTVVPDDRWREWSEQARREGFVRALAVPSQVNEDVSLALNLYSRSAGPWDERLVHAAGAYSALIASAVNLQLAFSDLDDAAGTLAHGTSEDEMVQRAIGAVMQTNGCSQDEAAELLRSASRRGGVPESEVARTVLRSLATASTGDIVDVLAAER